MLHKKLMQECVQDVRANFWIVQVTCSNNFLKVTPNILTPNQITFEKERGKNYFSFFKGTKKGILKNWDGYNKN